MIDRTHPLPVVQQCQLLGVARSTIYYEPRPVSDTALALMRRIDQWHLRHPFAGAWMLRAVLRREGRGVGRRHVATLMGRMGITAEYREPRTSQRHPAHRVYPYLLRDLAISRPNHVWAADLTSIPMPRGFVYLFVWSTTGQSPGAGVAAVQHADHGLLPQCRAGGDHPVWQTGDVQHGSRMSVWGDMSKRTTRKMEIPLIKSPARNSTGPDVQKWTDPPSPP